MVTSVFKKLLGSVAALVALCAANAAFAAPPGAEEAKGEMSLMLPDFTSVSFMGTNGRTLLMTGLVVCALGLVFGLVIYQQLRKMPVHKSMLEISELIYETCKTYLLTQAKFILLLEVFIGAIIIVYFGVLLKVGWGATAIIFFFSLVGIAGSAG